MKNTIKKNELNELKIDDFKKVFGKIDFSRNVRNPETYMEKAEILAQSIIESRGNVEPIIVADIDGKLQIVSGFRRSFCFLNDSKITWEEDTKNEETGKKEKETITADFSNCNIKVQHIGDLEESEYYSRLCNHTTTKSLDRYGQVQTIERLYKTRRGEHTANRQIQRITGLSRAIVTQSIKAIELDKVSNGFLDSYIKGDVKTGDMNEIYPKLNEANEKSGDVRTAMLKELESDCERISSAVEEEKPVKPLSKKELQTLRDNVATEYVALIEYVLGHDISIKTYLK